MALITIPSKPQQVSLGERAVIALFQGAGGLLGSVSSDTESTGIDAIEAQLAAAFPDYFLDAQVFSSFQGDIFNFQEVGSQQAKNYINQFDDVGGLAAVGYSAGGLSAIRLAQSFAPQRFDLVEQIDSYDPLSGSSPEDEILPGNVDQGINYYQNRNRFNTFEPDWDPTDLQGAQVVQGSENIDAEVRFNDPSLTHRTIDDNPALQAQILQDIETYVLQDLKFDRDNQLTLSGGARLENNLLVLEPDVLGEPGMALLSTPTPLEPDFAFQTRFQFRMSPGTEPSPGLAFWIQPLAEGTPLSLTFNPLFSTPDGALSNGVSLQLPEASSQPLAQAIAPLNFDSGQPITAWVDYIGAKDSLSVYLSDTLVKPTKPLLRYTLELADVVGPTAQFGFRSAVDDQAGQADLLSWQFNSSAQVLDVPPPVVMPDNYLPLSLTQRAASTWFGVDISSPSFEVNGLDFSQMFDEAAYLRQNPDVWQAVMQGAFASGYEHFITNGWLQGRNPSCVYDEAYYLSTNPDVAQAVAAGSFHSGLEHFARFGHVELRDPSASFDQSLYLDNHPNVEAEINSGEFLSGFDQWLDSGAAQGWGPQQLLFQENVYLAQNPDVAAAVAAGTFVDGFEHYMNYGCYEGRSPSPAFDEAQYPAQNPDVVTATNQGQQPCAFADYLVSGRFDG